MSRWQLHDFLPPPPTPTSGTIGSLAISFLTIGCC